MMLLRERLTETNDRPDLSTAGVATMTRLTHTTAIALILSLSALSGARAANNTPYVYGLPNTTINSSIKPYVVPNTIYSQPNTTINSSIKPYVVPNTVYSQPNATMNWRPKGAPNVGGATWAYSSLFGDAATPGPGSSGGYPLTGATPGPDGSAGYPFASGQASWFETFRGF
jgi:hypothetical protein